MPLMMAHTTSDSPQPIPLQDIHLAREMPLPPPPRPHSRVRSLSRSHSSSHSQPLSLSHSHSHTKPKDDFPVRTGDKRQSVQLVFPPSTCPTASPSPPCRPGQAGPSPPSPKTQAPRLPVHALMRAPSPPPPGETRCVHEETSPSGGLLFPPSYSVHLTSRHSTATSARTQTQKHDQHSRSRSRSRSPPSVLEAESPFYARPPSPLPLWSPLPGLSRILPAPRPTRSIQFLTPPRSQGRPAVPQAPSLPLTSRLPTPLPVPSTQPPEGQAYLGRERGCLCDAHEFHTPDCGSGAGLQADHGPDDDNDLESAESVLEAEICHAIPTSIRTASWSSSSTCVSRSVPAPAERERNLSGVAHRSCSPDGSLVSFGSTFGVRSASATASTSASTISSAIMDTEVRRASASTYQPLIPFDGSSGLRLSLAGPGVSSQHAPTRDDRTPPSPSPSPSDASTGIVLTPRQSLTPRSGARHGSVNGAKASSPPAQHPSKRRRAQSSGRHPRLLRAPPCPPPRKGSLTELLGPDAPVDLGMADWIHDAPPLPASLEPRAPPKEREAHLASLLTRQTHLARLLDSLARLQAELASQADTARHLLCSQYQSGRLDPKAMEHFRDRLNDWRRQQGDVLRDARDRAEARMAETGWYIAAIDGCDPGAARAGPGSSGVRREVLDLLPPPLTEEDLERQAWALRAAPSSVQVQRAEAGRSGPPAPASKPGPGLKPLLTCAPLDRTSGLVSLAPPLSTQWTRGRRAVSDDVLPAKETRNRAGMQQRMAEPMFVPVKEERVAVPRAEVQQERSLKQRLSWIW